MKTILNFVQYLLKLLKNEVKDGYWGRFKSNLEPEVRYDPMQSYITDIGKIGFRIHINQSRNDRPRDQKRRTDKKEKIPADKSILIRISKGLEAAIVLSGDKQLLSSHLSEPALSDLSEYSGITIINKFASINYFAEQDPGISVVTYSNNYTEHLDEQKPIFDILISLQTALINLLTDKSTSDILKTSIIFFNIGVSSGASLRQLHAQSYVMNSLNGMISEAFYRAYDPDNCLQCRLANNNGIIVDHLGQQINIDDLIIWEDNNVRLIHPFAPIRPFSLRILIKKHVPWFGNLDDKQLLSISKAMHYTFVVLKAILPASWDRILDRSIAFRQSLRIDMDYHMLIDLMSTIPMGAAEIVDSLSITAFKPETYALKMREALS